MYCLGDGNQYQRLCDSVRSYLKSCKNYNFLNNLKNGNNMHLCKVKVISECWLSWISSNFSLWITIQNQHKLLSYQINPNNIKISRINFTYIVRNMIATSWRIDHYTAKGIKSKLLKLFNNVS